MRGRAGSTRKLAVLAAGAALCLPAAGCGDDDENDATAAPPALPIAGVEYAFDVPDNGKAGFVSLEVSNEGQELHEYSLVQLDEGKTQEDVEAYLQTEPQGPPNWAEDIGGVPLLSPGENLTITRELDPATYTLVCFIPNPRGIPHIELGMIDSFELTGRSGAAKPEPDAVIRATPEGYEVPEIESGTQTIELRNADDREREFFLLDFEPGKDLADVDRFFSEGEDQAEPPATFLGAMQTIPPGTSVFLELDLKAGNEYTLSDNTGQRPVSATFTPR